MRKVVNQGPQRGGGFRPTDSRGGSSMVSGLNPDDYDIPTFFKSGV